jgi:hypothetical protein
VKCIFLLSFLKFSRYKPETKQDKAKRLKDVATSVAAGAKADAGKKVNCCFAACVLAMLPFLSLLLFPIPLNFCNLSPSPVSAARRSEVWYQPHHRPRREQDRQARA